jgi:hypothetical protein
MTETNCDLFTHNQSRSYLNYLVHIKFCVVTYYSVSYMHLRVKTIRKRFEKFYLSYKLHYLFPYIFRSLCIYVYKGSETVLKDESLYVNRNYHKLFRLLGT